MNHYVDVGDPQRGGEELAVCTCGWKARVPDSEDMTPWGRHVALMQIAKGHEYANAWVILDEERMDDFGLNETFVSDGL